jgi:hypothetical protein
LPVLLWIGGIDAGGQLKDRSSNIPSKRERLLAWTARCNDGTIEEATCNAYDRHWKVNRTEIDDFFRNDH